MTIKPGYEAVDKLADATNLQADEIQLMQTTGLAHQHYRLGTTGKLARVPIHSQHGYTPKNNLIYQEACFARVSRSGFGPKLFDTMPVSPELPMGALIVEEIFGRPSRLPGDLTSIAECLATIHNLPAQPEPPLAHHPDPVAGLKAEIEGQATFLEGNALFALQDELTWMRAYKGEAEPEPTCLVCTDTHPGNFLIDKSGKAIIVDLEKVIYGSPSVDLAHTSVYTSTTWDLHSAQELTLEDVRSFYKAYLERSDKADGIRPWLIPMRRLLILRALTWCALWQSEHKQAQSGWSKDQVPDTLTAHVAERTSHFLEPATLNQIFTETGALNL